MLNTKKTLIVKISYDVSSVPDAAIPHYKAGMKATALASGLKEDQIDFEVIESNEDQEESSGDVMFVLLRSLFERILGNDDDDEVVHDEE